MPTPKNTTLLYADIVGYTKLMRTDKDDALAKLEHFKTLMQSQTDAHQGEVLQFQRDNCLAAFANTADAVACAEALQMNFKAEPNVPVRMGIHAGEVVVEKDNAFGEGVFQVTQIEKIGIAGSVVISKEIQVQLADKEQFYLESLGTFKLKNFDQPIEVFALTNDGLSVPESSAEMLEEQKQAQRKRWLRALQLFAGYLVAAWTIIQFVDWLLHRYDISPYWTDILLWTFIGIIPSLLIYLVHQDRINQRILLRREKIIIPLNILLLFGALTVAYGGADLGSITKNISFTDADGRTVTQTVIKPEFVKQIPLFSFEQEGGTDSTAWMGIALQFMIGGDMIQDKYLNIINPGFVQEKMDKINAAKQTNGAYYIDGTYRVSDASFEIIPTLRDKRNGAIVSQRIFQGNDFFTLIDSISLYLRQEIGITPAQMKQSVDLDVKDFFTDNFEALRYRSLGIMGKGDVNFEKAIELDSTFVVASWIYASSLYNAPRGQLEAKYYITMAMRHRKKLPFEFQITTMLENYKIWGEWDKAEQLIKLQLELEPNNTYIFKQALQFYWSTGQLEKVYALQNEVYERFPTFDNKMTLLGLALRKGETGIVEKETKKLLKEYPQNLEVLQLLAEVYIQQQEYDAAKATVEQMILIDPDQEVTLSILLDAIIYMKANPDYVDKLATFEGKFRHQFNEGITEFRISNKVIWTRTENTSGWYMYPAGESILVPVNTYSLVCLKNDKGEVYAMKFAAESSPNLWKQDSLIWQAEEMLRNRWYEVALKAYETAITKYPDHYYLYDAKAHIEYMLSKTDAEIQQLYRRYVGQYGDVRIWIEDGQLFYKRPGEPRRILRPISDTEFMNLYAYNLKYHVEFENGAVKGIFEQKNDYNNLKSFQPPNTDSRITPIAFTTETEDERVSTIIKDTLDLLKLKLSKENLAGYKIIPYVNSLNAINFWFRQDPVNASADWSAEAYLGGTGQYSAKNGEVFRVAYVLTKNELPAQINSLSELERNYAIIHLPQMRTITIKRKSEYK